MRFGTRGGDPNAADTTGGPSAHGAGQAVRCAAGGRRDAT